MKQVTDASFYQSTTGNFIRSSAIKTLESCSWLYHCAYTLKLPSVNNNGALMGNVCHSFFECLLHDRHHHFIEKILVGNSVKAEKATERLVIKLIKNNDLPSTSEIFDKIDNMIVVGLKSDFLVKGGKIVGNEYRFKIQNESPKYNIFGTIDRITIKGKNIFIDDFKSSKKKYEGEEVSANVQALMYSLAATKLWPKLKPIVRFIFLQFPENPIIQVEFKKEILAGFEEYLASIQTTIDNFTMSDAKNNFAADKNYGTNTFSGKLVCGFASRPGQLKKDGTKMYYCPFKFPYDYYVSVKEGVVIRSALTLQELAEESVENIEKRHYDGCPRWSQPINDLITPKVVIEKKTNVLDDF